MSNKKNTVLVIDDSPESIFVLDELLRPQYRVLAANSGQQGLSVANGEPKPDLILLDVMMPGMDGYEVLARLREASATRDIPVIFLTALAADEEVERGLLLGAADYISKPITHGIVQARVRAQIEAKQARDWLKNQNALLESEVAQRIAETLAAQAQLRDLTAHLQTVREEEKSSIAREVHDELGGTLTALKMEVSWLSEELSDIEKENPLLKHTELMTQLAENAVSVTRRIITGLRPSILDDLGLLAAIEWQSSQFNKRTGINCQVHCVEDKVKLNKQYLIALFRIFQEALTNISRHSGATGVEVEYYCADDEVMLSVRDNGCGLPDGHVASPTSYGMIGMCERVDQLGGKIKFDSPVGGGFSITVILPLQVEGSKERTE